ncbi:MAG: tetratricopeptide repeat protein [Deltaproteobacteria bacterium]|jgi:Flp pilus assembly protein TadD|nr:tetratricopeptide repeat protein [Deltaproteobacteria bacterium]
MKIWSRLSAGDLARFKDGLASELGMLFDALSFSAGPEPDPDAFRRLELSFRGRRLGWLNATLRDPERPPSEEVAALIPGVAGCLLEKAALMKALTLDRESGLSNRDRFLARAARLMPPLEQGPRSLALDGASPTGLSLGLIETAREWTPEARALARRLSSLPGIAALGRISDGLLGIILRSGQHEARSLLDAALGTPHLPSPVAAVATFPDDLGPEDLNPVREPQPSLALLERARTALAFARARGSGRGAVAFRDVLAGMGRITQVLPQDRVITDLGRAAGAAAGQVFAVSDGAGGIKCEIALFETAPGYSLARIASGSGRGLTEGDRLAFLRVEEPMAAASGLPRTADPDPGRKEFMLETTRLAEDGRPLVFALARLDDSEKLSATLGPAGAEAKMDAFARALSSGLPWPPDRSGPWEPGSRAFVWESRPEGLQEALAAFLKGDLGPGGVSMALVGWPSEVLAPDGIAQAAAAALLEGAMTGGAVAVTFGPQTLNIIGDRLFDEGDTEGAAREYRRGLQLDPAHLNLLNSLGVCYGRAGDQKAAEAAFDDVLRLDPDNLMAAFNKGCSLILTGRTEEAELWLEKAAALDPKNFEILFQLGKAAIELGHPKKALDALGAAAALKSRRGAVFGLLGRARVLAGDSQGAMAAFKQAVKADPDDAQSLSALGALYREESHDDQMALSLMRRAVELDPSNCLFRNRLGRLLYDMGRFADAEHHLKSALEYSGGGTPGDGGLEILAARLEQADGLAGDGAPPECLEGLNGGSRSAAEDGAEAAGSEGA